MCSPPPVALGSDDLGLQSNLDACGLNLVDEVLRHVVHQRLAPAKQGHVLRETAGVHRRLTPRVPGADDVHLSSLELLGVRAREAVEDADTVELLERGYAQPAIGDPHCEDHAARLDLRAVGGLEHVSARALAQAGDLAHEEERRAEDPRLLVCAGRKLAAGDAALEAEVVPDPRARASLAADRRPLDDDRPETFRRRIDSGGEACRAGTDDGYVEALRVGLDPGV